jgi:hypothetical protein
MSNPPIEKVPTKMEYRVMRMTGRTAMKKMIKGVGGSADGGQDILGEEREKSSFCLRLRVGHSI